MIKNLKRFAKQQELLIESIGKSDNLFEIVCPMTPENGVKLQNTRNCLFSGKAMKVSVSPNPNFLSWNQPDLSWLPVNKLNIEACESAFGHTFLEGDLDTPKENLWITFLGVYASFLGHAVIILPDESGKKRFYLRLHSGKVNEFLEELNKIIAVLNLPLNLSAQKADGAWISIRLNKNLEAAVNFYINRESEWLRSFSDQLGDKLSREALFSFLRQRMLGKIFYDTNIFYAMTPTPGSAKVRLEAFQRYSAWPWLVSSSAFNLPFMVINSFILQQYRIPGVIEVKASDTVLDVGAAYGDTTVFFSERMRNQGKIFAVDPLPDNIKDLKENLRLHGCANVEILPYGLGDREELAWVRSRQADSNSVAEISKNQDANSAPIKITTLDALCRDMRVDFVKADIEGAELAMIHGGKETIKRDKPVFALALYHKENDFRDFPQALSSYNPDYVYFIRLDAEPMFFAIDKNKLPEKR